VETAPALLRFSIKERAIRVLEYPGNANPKERCSSSKDLIRELLKGVKMTVQEELNKCLLLKTKDCQE
jgi:hypothetical protein